MESNEVYTTEFLGNSSNMMGRLLIEGHLVDNIEIRHIDQPCNGDDFIVGYGPERSLLKPLDESKFEPRRFVNGDIVSVPFDRDFHMALESAILLLQERLSGNVVIDMPYNPEKVLTWCEDNITGNNNFASLDAGQVVVGFIFTEPMVRQLVVILPIGMISATP